MKIFVTGGTGFIGTHLVKKLREKGHSLLLLNYNLSDTEKWQKEVEEFSPNACIHLAWEGLPDYGVDLSKKNFDFGFELIKFLADIGCKTIVAVGSGWEREGRFPKDAVDGTVMSKKPADAFTVAKWSINLWGTALVGEKNREKTGAERSSFIWGRILYVYGPGQRETSLIPYLINCAKESKVPEIKNIFVKNDYIYIDDLVEVISSIVGKCRKSAEFDLGTGILTSTREIAKIVAEKFGLQKKWEKIFSANKKENQSANGICADISRIKKEIGWKPEVSIKEGINKMVNYMAGNE